MQSSEWDVYVDSTPPSGRVLRLRTLNDRFRETFIGGKTFITAGIEALSLIATTEILDRVREFYRFEASPDPNDEHDFGGFEWQTHTIFWKIDYYARDLQHASPDPTQPHVTTRVLTIMLAAEY